MLITLRLVHIVLGSLWVGMALFSSFLLVPAFQDAGPDGGKVAAALQRRGMMTLVPIVAIGTLLSGLALLWIVSGHFSATYMRSPMGRTFSMGGGLAILAWMIGMVIMRPAMMQSTALMASLASAAEPERAAAQVRLGRLRARGAMSGKVVTALLLLAVSAMAVARYL